MYYDIFECTICFGHIFNAVIGKVKLDINSLVIVSEPKHQNSSLFIYLD